MARRESLATGPGSRALVVDLIRSSGPISRVELVKSTGLTQPTISNIVRRLIEDGVVRETGDTVATRGKPRSLLVINSHAAYGVGIHLATDALTCVVTDTRGGTVGRLLVAAPPAEDPGAVAEALAGLYRDVVAGLGLPARGIAGLAVVGPGPVDVAQGSFLALP
ncbi:Winged helix-turn-helix DNA-binding, partial [Streptomyces sp. SolWspMP-sol7th]